jgi:pimeloyl-ACP methyl ester carboxylesterase
MELDYLGQLGGIQAPALVVVGEEDPGTPVSAARALQDRISGSRLVILPQARHLSSVERAEAFNRAVLEFLTTL